MLEFYWMWIKKAFPLAYSIAGIILFLLTMLTPFITAKYPQWEKKMEVFFMDYTFVCFFLLFDYTSCCCAL